MTDSSYPTAPPPAPPVPPAPPRNGPGTAALVLGIIGAIFAFIPVIGAFVGIPLAILAVIFGAVGYARARKGRATNKGVAISGLVLGIAAFVLSIVMIVLAAVAVNQALSGGAAPPAVSDEDPAAKQAEGGGNKSETTAGVGDPVSDGNLTFTVTDVQESQTIGEGMFATEAHGKYVIVALTVKNTGDQAVTFNAGPSQVAYDTQDRQYSTSDDAIMSGSAEDENSFLQQINPGSSVDGRLVYDVPEKTELVRIHLQGGMTSSGVDVALR